MKKFYVGSQTAPHSDWAHQTLKGAIEHAKRLVESTNTDQYVVQVVRVVKRAPRPIVVETLR